MKLKKSFYINGDTLEIARSLIGKVLYSNSRNCITAGIITETEAYLGEGDRASHAYGGLRTKRTETMYAQGGVSYVYLCYGIHSLFNVVTGPAENPQAVLIRAVVPYLNASVMLRRRNMKKGNSAAFNGPGKLTTALGITCLDDGSALTGDKIWIEDKGIRPSVNKLRISPRIGVDYAGSDALLPYRFFVEEAYLEKSVI